MLSPTAVLHTSCSSYTHIHIHIHIRRYTLTGPSWPNTSSHLAPLAKFHLCGRKSKNGCLFNIKTDPYERNTLAPTQVGLFTTMLARLDEMQKTVYVVGIRDMRNIQNIWNVELVSTVIVMEYRGGAARYISIPTY